MTDFDILKYLEYKKDLYMDQGEPIKVQVIEEVIEEIKKIMTEDQSEWPKDYDISFGDSKLCVCGHPYVRHFDPYEDMSPVGCKYCGCYEFREKEGVI